MQQQTCGPIFLLLLFMSLAPPRVATTPARSHARTHANPRTAQGRETTPSDRSEYQSVGRKQKPWDGFSIRRSSNSDQWLTTRAGIDQVPRRNTNQVLIFRNRPITDCHVIKDVKQDTRQVFWAINQHLDQDLKWLPFSSVAPHARQEGSQVSKGETDDILGPVGLAICQTQIKNLGIVSASVAPLIRTNGRRPGQVLDQVPRRNTNQVLISRNRPIIDCHVIEDVGEKAFVEAFGLSISISIKTSNACLFSSRAPLRRKEMKEGQRNRRAGAESGSCRRRLALLLFFALHRCQKTSDVQRQHDLCHLEGGLMWFLC